MISSFRFSLLYNNSVASVLQPEQMTVLPVVLFIELITQLVRLFLNGSTVSHNYVACTKIRICVLHVNESNS